MSYQVNNDEMSNYPISLIVSSHDNTGPADRVGSEEYKGVWRSGGLIVESYEGSFNRTV